MVKRVKKLLPFFPEKSDILLFSGGASLFYGLNLIYPPASFIACGVILIALAFITARPVVKAGGE
jgi:hypothetical protein